VALAAVVSAVAAVLALVLGRVDGRPRSGGNPTIRRLTWASCVQFPRFWRIQLRPGRGAGEPQLVNSLLAHGGHAASLHLEGQFGQGSLDRVWSMMAMAVFCGSAVGKLRTGVQLEISRRNPGSTRLGDGLRPWRLMRSSPASTGVVVGESSGPIWADRTAGASGAITLHASRGSREGTAHGRRLHGARHRADRPASRGQ
jgi:hypothetical protein